MPALPVLAPSAPRPPPPRGAPGSPAPDPDHISVTQSGGSSCRTLPIARLRRNSLAAYAKGSSSVDPSLLPCASQPPQPQSGSVQKLRTQGPVRTSRGAMSDERVMRFSGGGALGFFAAATTTRVSAPTTSFTVAEHQPAMITDCFCVECLLPPASSACADLSGCAAKPTWHVQPCSA